MIEYEKYTLVEVTKERRAYQQIDPLVTHQLIGWARDINGRLAHCSTRNLIKGEKEKVMKELESKGFIIKDMTERKVVEKNKYLEIKK